MKTREKQTKRRRNIRRGHHKKSGRGKLQLYFLLAGLVLATGIGVWLYHIRDKIPPDDPLYRDQKNLKDIEIEAAWEKGYTGKNVRIAIIDTGVAPHDDLDMSRIEGRNYTGEKKGDYADRIGHGTFIAGMLSAKRNNGGGIAGMTRSTLVALKVVGEEQPGVSIEMVAKAVRDAYQVYHCSVISMSMGTPNDHEELKKAIDEVTQKGVIVVAAAGGTSEQVYYPAGYENVIGVGAMDERLAGMGEGAGNKSVFVTAPGEKLIGPEPMGGYERRGSGASYAAAHVTAMAAFAKQHDQTISVKEMKQVLKNTVEDRGVKGYDPGYGWGAINISRFIDELEKD